MCVGFTSKWEKSMSRRSRGCGHRWKEKLLLHCQTHFCWCSTCWREKEICVFLQLLHQLPLALDSSNDGQWQEGGEDAQSRTVVIATSLSCWFSFSFKLIEASVLHKCMYKRSCSLVECSNWLCTVCSWSYASCTIINWKSFNDSIWFDYYFYCPLLDWTCLCLCTVKDRLYSSDDD